MTKGFPVVARKEVNNMTSICIFTEMGRTYTFKNVTITCDNETVLCFSYKAMSDGNEKVATFQKSRIVGWSIQK
jgi:hypothetical protein